MSDKSPNESMKLRRKKRGEPVKWETPELRVNDQVVEKRIKIKKRILQKNRCTSCVESDCCQTGIGCVRGVKAITTRVLFAIHSIVCVLRVTHILSNNYYWYFAATLGLLLIETIVTLLKNKAQEWKWFCPSFLFFLMSTAPSIWCLELDRLDRYRAEAQFPNVTLAADGKDDLIAELTGISIPPDTWIMAIEQSQMLLLIIGRWLLPKGSITRNELSQLLLVYIGMACDIMEFFILFEEEIVIGDTLFCYVILVIWTVSLLQFTFVLTSHSNNIDNVKSNTVKPSNADGIGEQTNDNADIEAQNNAKKTPCNVEILAILTNVFMQEIPFMVCRLYVLVYHNLINYTIIFFTIKNILVNILQFYRLVVIISVHCESNDTDANDDDLITDEESDGEFKNAHVNTQPTHAKLPPLAVSNQGTIGKNMQKSLNLVSKKPLAPIK
ncbi:unnamed protein product [Owenia fusiformis]|uniref:Transmembrane protein 26 n=1 Tax=Owenia fusiformis TaxID=6347 RepID=A0A8S4QAW2_OWEFU|nr:unnamed protein product [Owenia fusiformis]